MGSSLQDFEFPERIIFPSSFSVMGSNAVNLGTLELQLDCTELLLGVNSFRMFSILLAKYSANLSDSSPAQLCVGKAVFFLLKRRLL